MHRSIYTLSKLHGVDSNAIQPKSSVTLMKAQRKPVELTRYTKADTTKWNNVGRGRLSNKGPLGNEKPIRKEKQIVKQSTTQQPRPSTMKQSFEKVPPTLRSCVKSNPLNFELRNHGCVVSAAPKINGILKTHLPTNQIKMKKPRQPCKEKYSPHSLICSTMPNNSKPTATKTDAVTLYQYYKRGWSHCHIPGESERYPTGWETR